MKKMLASALAAVLVFGSVTAFASAAESSFTDVPSDAWYTEPVVFACSKGLMSGVGQDCFDPQGAATRATAVTALWRGEGSPTASSDDSDSLIYGKFIPFVDLPIYDGPEHESWYSGAVRWAYWEGIAYGYELPRCGDEPAVYGYEFRPDSGITREELATVLYRYACSLGIDTSGRDDLSGYSDADAVSAFAKEAMQWCVATGIISGTYESGHRLLDPRGTATRAELATILMRFYGKFPGAC